MVNSRSKGKRGELEVAALIKSHGWEARRGQQFAGGGDSPDVVHNIDDLHIEVKYVEAFSLWASLDQANRDKKEEDTPVVFHRKKNKPWVVVLEAEDFLEILKYAQYAGWTNT